MMLTSSSKEQEETNALLRTIWKAVDANFYCIRPKESNFYKPLRAKHPDRKSIAPHIKVRFTHNGKDYDTAFQIETPIITAIGLADFFAIDPIDTMDMFAIEAMPEYEYKLAAYTAMIRQANLAAALRANEESTENLPDNMKEDYRFFCKVQLCMNYIKFHSPQKSEYFSGALVSF